MKKMIAVTLTTLLLASCFLLSACTPAMVPAAKNSMDEGRPVVLQAAQAAYQENLDARRDELINAGESPVDEALLARFGVSADWFEGMVNEENTLGYLIARYRNPETRATFDFEPALGFLRAYDLVGGSVSTPQSIENETAVSEDLRKQAALEFYAAVTEDFALGESRVDEEDHSEHYSTYLISEYLDGEKTGTNGHIVCTQAGRILMASFAKSEIYVDGTPQGIQNLRRASLTEEEARSLANEAVAAMWTEEAQTWSAPTVSTPGVLEVNGNQRYWSFEIAYPWPCEDCAESGDTASCTFDDHYIQYYWIDIDALTGECLRLGRSY